MSTAQPGWYDDGTGHNRWWDGQQWGPYAPAEAERHTVGPMTASQLDVKREVSYVRQQKGHSLTLWIFLSFMMFGIPWLIYYSVSPNHYWHA